MIREDQVAVGEDDTVITLGDVSDDDIEHVRNRLTQGDRLLAVYKADRDAVDKAASGQIKCLAVCPLFWPHLIIMSPCLCVGMATAKEVGQNTLYAITDQGVWTMIRDYKPSGCTCCTPGIDTNFLPYDQIIGIQTDGVGRGMKMFMPPSVFIQQMGVTVSGGKNSTVRPNGQSWLINHSHLEEVAKLLRQKLADFKHNGGRAPIIQQAPIAAVTQEKIRVFVCQQEHPDQVQILMLDPSWTFEQFQMEAYSVVASKGGNLYLKKGEMEIPITSPEHLNEDDQIVIKT